MTLTVQPEGRLETWSPDDPRLYGLVLSLGDDRTSLDTRYERFGWRQLTIHGREVRLNGRRIQMVGDFCHPFGPFMMTRRFAWAWCRMIQDVGGNALRPHAQPFPRIFLDVADEMGVLVLDETALFGSSIRLNPEAPELWSRFARHYERLIQRDRNHPCVFGWSFGNEMFAIPRLNNLSPADAADYYEKLTAVGLRGAEWDPTRVWLSCDGDEDLGGALPVRSQHHGHGLPLLPELDKPRMVGESGGTYYATPEQLSVFNGDRAYESYFGRNEALATDLYENLTRSALPRLAYFSPSELVWFGLEHLPLGQEGSRGTFAVYFSFWVQSPRSLDDLLLAGPDAPRLTAFCYASESCRLWCNAQELKPTRTEPADYRTLHVFDGVPLTKGWNHFLVKLVSARLEDPEPGTLAVRIRSNDPDYFRELESAIELPASARRGAGDGP